MDNTTTKVKTKESPIDKDYMSFRSDCTPEYARAQFEKRHGCKPTECFIDANNQLVKVGPIPNGRKATA